jgi:preprotein translocase subunit YajC
MIQLLQTAPSPAPSGLLQFAPMIFIFVIFYFLLIAPMRKKQKKTQEMLAALKKGDEVVTGGGIFGRVAALDDERGFVVLQIADNVKVKVLRSAIAGLAGQADSSQPTHPS